MRTMTKEEFRSLHRGDIIRIDGRSDSYVIDRPTSNGYIVVRTIEASHHSEWILCIKDGKQMNKE